MKRIIGIIVAIVVLAGVAAGVYALGQSYHWWETPEQSEARKAQAKAICESNKTKGLDEMMKMVDLPKKVSMETVDKEIDHANKAIQYFEQADDCPGVDVKQELSDAYRARQIAQERRKIIKLHRDIKNTYLVKPKSEP